MDTKKYQFYFVGTPIGNFSEFNERAIETLQSVDEILCEDTKHSLPLLCEFNIKKPLSSFHKFNYNQMIPVILEKLANGKTLALITDAGMPAISDPGQELVPHLQENNIDYTVISGSCAFVNALVLSGLSTDSFTFVGFLGDKAKTRQEKIDEVKDLKSTLIFYSSVHDINKDLQFLFENLGQRKVFVARELTKLYEEKIWGQLGEIQLQNPKGEFVVVVEGAKQVQNTSTPLEQYEMLLSLGLERKEAMKQVAQFFEMSKNEVYKQIQDAKDNKK